MVAAFTKATYTYSTVHSRSRSYNQNNLFEHPYNHAHCCKCKYNEGVFGSHPLIHLPVTQTILRVDKIGCLVSLRVRATKSHANIQTNPEAFRYSIVVHVYCLSLYKSVSVHTRPDKLRYPKLLTEASSDEASGGATRALAPLRP
jgi:hypothetical protein